MAYLLGKKLMFVGRILQGLGGLIMLYFIIGILKSLIVFLGSEAEMSARVGALFGGLLINIVGGGIGFFVFGSGSERVEEAKADRKMNVK